MARDWPHSLDPEPTPRARRWQAVEAAVLAALMSGMIGISVRDVLLTKIEAAVAALAADVAKVERMIAQDERRLTLELIGARHRARHAVGVLGVSARPIAPGLILTGRDLEVLLAVLDGSGRSGDSVGR